jgi:hypothetical protein
MTTENRPLRRVVERWLGGLFTNDIRIKRIGRDNQRHWRCVRADIECQSRLFSILFFRHEDGSWQVFPPEVKRPVMGKHCEKF